MSMEPNVTPESSIAVLIPCFNESEAIAGVVAAFRKALPTAEIHVYDNNSSDDTVAVARAAGAHVGYERYQGKGHVVRRMFADIDAGVYVLVDGDGTYDAASAPRMVDILLQKRLDMVVGSRQHTQASAYRSGHVLGNRMLTWLLGTLFGRREMSDILTGYRVFSHRFVKSFPALATGFETETELTVHALELHMPVDEVETPYGARAEGSASKLNTYRDGLRILFLMLRLFEKERPLPFYGILFAGCWLVALVLGIPLVLTYLESGLVPRFPTASGVVGLILLGFVSLVAGMITDSVALGRRETKRLFYLSVPQFGYRRGERAR
jgi:glycosyltransferase involved in cell wall biosynthesis